MGRGLGRTTLSGRRSRVWSFLAPALGISSPRVLNPSPDRDPSTHTEPHLRPVWLLQVWDGYVRYRMFGLSVTVAGTGLGVGGWVSGILNIPHPWEPPDLCKVGGSPISWGCRSRAFTGLCHPGGRYSGLWVVLLVSPRGWVRVRCRRFIRCVMCRLWLGRWRRHRPLGSYVHIGGGAHSLAEPPRRRPPGSGQRDSPCPTGA